MSIVSPPNIVSREIRIRGVVQGVGFRPYVYNLAKKIGLRGFVRNSSSGLTIAVEGFETAVEQFLRELRQSPPALAVIEEFTVEALEPFGAGSFEIQESLAQEGEFVLVSPDVATCEDCWSDVLDPDNRRYGYPFTNCTNCGPRYTIIQDIPYDRPMTTMAGFRMCPECQAEYCDPANRRFHAQPNACPRCGPSLELIRDGSSVRALGYGQPSLPVLRDVRALLREGRTVAIKGLGGFHLACDAENADAVESLRKRKKRSDKPFALMAHDIAAVEKFCFVTPADRRTMATLQRPIVILKRRPDSGIAAAVAPGNNTLGVMLPYTPLHLFLFGDAPKRPPEFTALVMTSGNLSDEPIVTSNEEARTRLRSVADAFLLHNRDIYMRVDDSVVRTFGAVPRVLRRSRGYAPQSIDLGLPTTELLACGAELKNAFCLTKGRFAILSQHIGDADNYETLEFFDETLANLKKLFRVEPRAVAHDLHPLYLTSRYARELPLPKIGVQHHHAHIASCMAENHLREKVIGVAFDGTGFGTDGQIWGGEFLVADYSGFERRAHLRYIPLAGGDVAVRQTWRSALSWLLESFGPQSPTDLNFLQHVPEKHVALVRRMLERRVNTILTSSCGRLFDAVSALLGIRLESSFEAQAAIELEVATVPGIDDAYPFEVEQGDPAQIDLRPTFRAIVRDLQRSQLIGVIASRFHNTMAAVISDVCKRIRTRDDLHRVCLSGGTFQNIHLLERAVGLLRANGFEVFLHATVPPNDGGIALGQAVIANHILQRG